MAELSKLKLPNNTTYDLKDATSYAHAVTNKGSAFSSGLYKITTNGEGHVTAATAVVKSDITGLGIPGTDTNTHRPIKVNGTQNLGDNTTALNLKNGTNVTITANSGDVTISATDTTYESKTAALDGTDVSLVTTGEKYIWNDAVERVDDLETEIDTKAPVIINTASGDIASFDDGADGMPIKGMTVSIEPVQDLNGYDNPWPAGGGKNKINAPDVTLSSGSYLYNDAIVLPAGTYTISFVKSTSGTPSATVVFYNGNGDAIVAGSHNIPWTFTLTEASASAKVYVSEAATYSKIQVESGSTATAYAPYSNICPITGWTGATVCRTGFNIWDEEREVGVYNSTTGAKAPSSGRIRNVNKIPIVGGENYTFRCSTGDYIYLFYYRKDESYIKYESKRFNIDGYVVFTPPENTRYLCFYMYGTEHTDISFNYPSTNHDYHAYSGSTLLISFPNDAETVYGGTLTVNQDGSGSLVVETQKTTITSFTSAFGATSNGYAVYRTVSGGNHRAAIGKEHLIVSNEFAYSTNGYSTMNLYEYGGTSGVNETFSFILPSSISSLNEANAWAAANPIEFTYYLATPLTYQLTAAQIYTLLGQNNIWANTGNVDVTYCADTKAYVDRTADIYYVEGSTSDAAGVWTGTVNGLTNYYDGLTVIYVTKVAGKSGSVTLNLNNLGAIQCYNTDKGAIAAITTHYPAGTPIMFTYYDGKFVTADYSRANDNTTNIHTLIPANGYFVADSAIYRYQMLVHVDDDKLSPFNNVNNSTKTTKTILTNVEFNPFKRIYYYYTTTNVAANANIGLSWLCYSCGAMDLRYSFNISASVNALTAHKDVYMKVSPQANGMVKLAAAFPFTQTLPSVDDGYWYIFIGRAYSTYQISLYPEHPIFRYDATEENLVRVLPQDAIATSATAGLMSVFDYNALREIDYNIYSCSMYGLYTVTIPANTLSYTLNSDFITGNTCVIYTSLQKDGFRATYINWVTEAGYITFTLGKTLSSALTFTFIATKNYTPEPVPVIN